MLVDGGYTGERFAQGFRQILGATVEVAKRNELHNPVVIPSAWWSSVPSPGWKNTGGCGRTASAICIPACSSSSSLLSLSCYEDIESLLRLIGPVIIHGTIKE
jgi:hypothetical protein